MRSWRTRPRVVATNPGAVPTQEKNEDRMTAYVIAEIAVLDAEGYEAYKPLAEASITAHGGRYRVRGGEVDSVEGDPVTGRVVVLEFPDLAAARSWYDSADYRAALVARQTTSSGRIYFVDGHDPA